MTSPTDNPEITIAPATDALRVPVVAAPPRDNDEDRRIAQAWAELRLTRPQLFDGPILLAHTSRTSVHHPLLAEVYRDTYRTLATAPDAPHHIRSLGVQALIIARDRAGDQLVLLARRSSAVRMYPGQWENAPAGGLDPAHIRADTLDRDAVLSALRAEAAEELGTDDLIDPAYARIVALLDDPLARSIDVVVRVELADPVRPDALPCLVRSRDQAEYVDAAWIPTSRVIAWIDAHPHAVSPPTRTLLRWSIHPSPRGEGHPTASPPHTAHATHPQAPR